VNCGGSAAKLVVNPTLLARRSQIPTLLEMSGYPTYLALGLNRDKFRLAMLGVNDKRSQWFGSL